MRLDHDAIRKPCSSIRREKRYLIECGSAFGKAIELFSKTALFKKYDWKIYAFEPNPNMALKTKERCAYLLQMKILEVIEKALWVENGTIRLYIGQNPTGSSIFREKTTGNLDKDNPLNVPSIYLGDWLCTHFSKDDFIMVSMNIEGAEYELLGKMLKDGSVEYINELCVEFHNERVGIQIARDFELTEQLRNKNVNVIMQTINDSIRQGLIE